MRSGCKARKMLGDRWVVHRKIGQGSFATVWQCYDERTNREVAIKGINREKISLHKKHQENLDNEIKIMKQLKHPNIIELYDIYPTRGHIYLIMEYAADGDLSKRIRAHGATSEAEARPLLEQLGLKFLRDHDIIHRDLKPQNLLLDNKKPSATLKIADFGFARYMRQESLAATLCGSPLYMAPEILRYQKYDGRKTDLWSVGAILFEVLTGRPPWTAATHVQLLERIERTKVVFPEKSTLSPQCVDLIMRLLRRDPAERLSFEDFLRHPFISKLDSLPPAVPLKSGESKEELKSEDILDNAIISIFDEKFPKDKSAIVESADAQLFVQYLIEGGISAIHIAHAFGIAPQELEEWLNQDKHPNYHTPILERLNRPQYTKQKAVLLKASGANEYIWVEKGSSKITTDKKAIVDVCRPESKQHSVTCESSGFNAMAQRASIIARSAKMLLVSPEVAERLTATDSCSCVSLAAALTLYLKSLQLYHTAITSILEWKKEKVDVVDQKIEKGILRVVHTMVYLGCEVLSECVSSFQQYLLESESLRHQLQCSTRKPVHLSAWLSSTSIELSPYTECVEKRLYDFAILLAQDGALGEMNGDRKTALKNYEAARLLLEQLLLELNKATQETTSQLLHDKRILNKVIGDLDARITLLQRQAGSAIV